ncbi:hypothetical protein ABFV99_13755 [Cytobacillus horneckiae]|uniref:hypothetical protein n=1 Tax=Cytobacillus horneckiae TaxID=549687 RepID=UPI0034CDE0F0
MELDFIPYEEKPVEPIKVFAHQFKKTEAEGFCFTKNMWANNPWVYDVDYTPEEFDRQRKIYGRAKKDLKPFVTINEVRIRPKHNQWIVLNEYHKPIEILDTNKFHEKYIKQ